jgi:hypothetical protein
MPRRNDGGSDRGFQERPSVDRLLPALVLENAPVAVVEADAAARAAVARWEQARVDAAEARRAVEQAPRLDAEAEQAAFNADRKLPAPTEPKRRPDQDAAQRTVALAQRVACDAIDELDRVVEAHKGELIGGFRETLEARHQRMLGRVDQLAGDAAEFDAETGIIGSLYFGDGFPKPNRRGGLAVEVARLAAAVTERCAAAVPRQPRILEAIGTGSMKWNDVAARLGVSQIDPLWCAARDQLVEDGELAWVDQHGAPVGVRDPLSMSIKPHLVPHTGPKPETRIEKVRRERREREAKTTAGSGHYSDSPTASRASRRLTKARVLTILPSLIVTTTPYACSTPTALCFPCATNRASTTTASAPVSITRSRSCRQSSHVSSWSARNSWNPLAPR